MPDGHVLDPPPEPDYDPGPVPDEMLEIGRTGLCKNCDYFSPIPNHPAAAGECRIGPPTVQIMLIPAPDLPKVRGLELAQAQAGPQILPMAAWPNVGPDQWCGAHSAGMP